MWVVGGKPAAVPTMIWRETRVSAGPKSGPHSAISLPDDGGSLQDDYAPLFPAEAA